MAAELIAKTTTGLTLQIVPEESASYDGVGEILPMSTNHLNICKFDSNTNDGYKVVKAKILQLVVGKTFVDKYKPVSFRHPSNPGRHELTDYLDRMLLMCLITMAILLILLLEEIWKS